jgi:hypothetical protein
MFEHPSKVCMTYIEHFKLSMGFSYMFAVASAKAFIHAIIPDVYIRSTTEVVEEADKIIKNSGCKS